MNESNGDFTCDLVIARYKENLDWLQKYSAYNFRNIYIYNKNQADNDMTAREIGWFLNKKKCIKINLINEGKCDHTYLYHIIHNYDTLADVTIFTKGSSDMYRENKKLTFTVAKVFETHDTVMNNDTHNEPVHLHASGFVLDVYKCRHPNNYTNEDDLKVKPASIRPFGKWYEHHFPGVNMTNIAYAGVFSVSRKHIRQHPKSYYENFIKEVEGHHNPEAGHYFERSWTTIFQPFPDSCFYNTTGFYLI
jgi:hypothetical protein